MSYKQRLEDYEDKKKKLVEELKLRVKEGKGIRLKKPRSNLFRHRTVSSSTIEVSDFNKVLNVDKENLIAEVEGMTTYEELVEETLKYDLMPTVVPQLKSITIGGAATGLGIESSSFKYGLVHETITEMEILIGGGSVVTCNATNKHKDLFFGFPNSYGTFGYALKIKVKLVPVKRYVKLTHLRFENPEDFLKEMANSCKMKKKFDFIDGVIFNEKEFYIILGEFVDDAPFVNDYTHMKIYYKSIQKNKEDYLTAADYIWRWDTDWFWCSKHFGAQNPLVRFLLGKRFLGSAFYWKVRSLIKKIKVFDMMVKLKLVGEVESVVQDIEIPIENAEKFISFFNKEIGIRPIWVCPFSAYSKKRIYDLYRMNLSKLYLNFGFWDMIKTKHENGYYNKKVERKVKELNGKKSLYSFSFYTKREFEEVYSLKAYSKLKKKYDPTLVFKGIYEKCVLGN